MKSRKTLTIIVATSLILASYNSYAQTAKELLPKAIQLEEVKGDLDEAIKTYQLIINKYPDNREVSAEALLRLGMCYEKLGNQEAVKTYKRLVSNFPEQKNQVAVARERLSRLIQIAENVPETPLIPKFTKINIPTKPGNGVLSPDGNKLSFISEDAVWIIPLHGKINSDIAGEPIRLKEIPGVWDNGSLMAWSADGKWIAVNGQANGKNAAYVIPVNGGEPRVVPMPDRGSRAWSARLSLSPDGQMLAFSAVDLDMQQEASNANDQRIYTIPVAGGEPKQVSSGWARMPSFSSDGKFISYAGYSEIDNWQKNTKHSRYNGELWVVSSAGETPLKLTTIDGNLRGPLWSPDGKYIAAHLEPGGTNDSREIWVYQLSPDASSVGEPGKITLPRSSWNMLAGWTPNNELGVFIQSEEHSAIYTVPASGGMAVQITPGELEPYYPRWSKNEEERIYFRGFNKDESVTLSYVPDAGGDPVGVPVRSERGLVSIIPGGGLNVSPNGKMVVISAYQKPYEQKEGVDLWTIPLDGGSSTRLTNDELYERYPCWSPDGRSIAFTRWHEKSKDKGFFAIYVIPSEGGISRQISSEMDSVAGGPIAYSPDGKQIAFFSGNAIKAISVEGGKTEVLVAEIKYEPHSDLFYSPDGSKIAHNAEGKIWITLLDGGKPQELRTGLPNNAKNYGFSWSPDGKKIAFITSIGGEAEFWLISNFLPLEKLAQQNKKENVTESEGIRIEPIWKEPGTDFIGSVSPDGRFHAFIYWGEGALAIRDLISGENKILTHDADAAKGFAMTPLFSRNGKQIAYSWWNPNHTYDLFLTDVNNPSPRRLYRHEGEHVDPVFWLSDKELIFSKYTYSTKKAQVCLINILDGTIHELKTFEIQHWPRVSGSPDEKYIAYDFANETDNGNFDINLLLDKGESEIPLIKHPANDRVLGWMPGRKEFLFISDRSGTWDLWAIPVDNGKPSGSAKRLYTDIGEVEPVGFAQNGDCFVGFARRINNTLIAPFNPETGEIDEKSGESLLGSPWTVGWSPDGKFLTYDNNIRDLTTGEERKFAETLQFSHLIRWSPDGNSVLVIGRDKNKLKTEGYKGGVYAVDMKTGIITEILLLSNYQYNTPGDDAFPLSDVQWSLDGKSIFYLFFKDRLARHDLVTGEDKILYRHSNFDRGVMKLSPDGKNLLLATRSPEEKKSRLFIIPIDGGKEKELCTAQEGDRFYRAEWSPDGKYVYFIEEKDGTSLWRIPAEGGIPQKTWHTKSSVNNVFGLHPDGKQIALAFPESTTEIRVIKNLVQELEKLDSIPK